MRYRSSVATATILVGSAACCLGQPILPAPTAFFGPGHGSSNPLIVWSDPLNAWNVTIRVIGPTADFDVHVSAASHVPISDLAINFNNTNFDVDLYVHGLTAATKCFDVRTIYPINTGGTGDLDTGPNPSTVDVRIEQADANSIFLSPASSFAAGGLVYGTYRGNPLTFDAPVRWSLTGPAVFSINDRTTVISSDLTSATSSATRSAARRRPPTVRSTTRS